MGHDDPNYETLNFSVLSISSVYKRLKYTKKSDGRGTVRPGSFYMGSRLKPSLAFHTKAIIGGIVALRHNVQLITDAKGRACWFMTASIMLNSAECIAQYC